MIACHRDPYQPQFPGIVDVRYAPGSAETCRTFEESAATCAWNWYRHGAHRCDVRTTDGDFAWHARIVAQRRLGEDDEPYYHISLRYALDGAVIGTFDATS